MAYLRISARSWHEPPLTRVTNEKAFLDGAAALASATGRDAAQIRREMLSWRRVVRHVCTTLLRETRNRRETHGAGGHLRRAEVGRYSWRSMKAILMRHAISSGDD